MNNDPYFNRYVFNFIWWVIGISMLVAIILGTRKDFSHANESWWAIGIFITVAFVCAANTRRVVGWVPDYSRHTFFRTYFERRFSDEPDHLGYWSALIIWHGGSILYPFWFILVSIFPPAKPQAGKVVAEAEEPEQEDEEDEEEKTPAITADLIPKTFRIEMQRVHPGIPDELLDQLETSARWFIATQHKLTTVIPLDEYTREANALVTEFSKLLAGLPFAPDGPVTVPLLDLVTLKHVQSFHYGIGNALPANRPGFMKLAWEGAVATSKRFQQAEREKWKDNDRDASNDVPEYLFDVLGEPGSREHIEYLLLHSNIASARIPIAPPPNARFSATWIIAPQGKGKTTLLSALLKRDLDKVAADQACVIIIDAKGDLTREVPRLAEFAPGGRLEEKLTLLDPKAHLAINPFMVGGNTTRSLAFVEYIFTALLDDISQVGIGVIRKIISACRVIPDASLWTVREMTLTKGSWKKYEKLIEQADEMTATYFASGKFDDPTTTTIKDAIFRRLEKLLTDVPELLPTFKSPQNRVNMQQLMDMPGVVVIDNNWNDFTTNGSEMIGRIFVALIHSAAQQRGGRDERDKLPVYVYMDEAGFVIKRDDKIAEIVQTCRSENIAMTFAHQELEQIASKDVVGALRNCAIKYGAPDAEAGLVADDFRMAKDDLRSLPEYHFALMMRGSQKPYTVAVPNDPVKVWPKMSSGSFASIQAQMREKYSIRAAQQEPTTAPEPDSDDTAPKSWG